MKGAQDAQNQPRTGEDGRERPGVPGDAPAASDGRVLVAGVSLPAEELADALAGYVTGRLLEDRRRSSGRAFVSGPWAEAIRRMRASAHQRPESWTPPHLVGCAEWAKGLAHGVDPATVRRWCKRGAVAGAVKVGNTWLLPADAAPPTRGRTST